MMKLEQLIETNEPDEWTNRPFSNEIRTVQKKMLSLDHQADLMMSKLDTWTKIAKGKVFTVTGSKVSLKLPKQVEAKPRDFLTWTLVHSHPNLITKVFVERTDPKIVLPIRALITRHNELSNKRAEVEGLLKRLEAEMQEATLKAIKAGKEARMKAFERDLKSNKY